DFRRNNSLSTTEYISATVNSGVMYNTHFFNKLFSFSTNARINQNLLTKVTTLSPDLNLSMQRIFPFKKEGDTRKNLLTDFNFSYGANAKAEVSNVGGIRTLSSAPEVVLLNGRYVSKNDVIKNIKQDTLDLFGHLPRYLKNTRFGMQHNLQASTNVTILKYFTGSLNFNYIEKWHPEQYRYRWIEQAKGVKVDTLRTFARTYEYNFSTSVQTRFYGFYSLKNGIQMRQQFAPTVGLSYRPDFSEPQFGMFQQVQVNSDGSTRRIAYTEGSFAGAASQGKSFSMNFGLASQLEGKVKKKQTGKDTTAVTEKIKILDNISVSTSYNFLADSFNLADIAMGTRTMLFDLIDINLQGVTLDPYYYAPLARSGREPSNAPTRYRRTPTYAFQAGKGIGIIKSATLAVGFRLSPATFKKKNAQQQSGGGQTTTQKKVEEEDNPILEDMRRNPDRYLNFNIPWSLNVSYSIRYNKSPDLTRTDYTQVIEFNGDFSLTPKWKITYRSGYDFQKKDFAFTNFGIVRDLHCWTMTVNWVPFGPRQSYTFDLAVRSSILQDLKISKRNDWYDTGVSANASRR
ncbi:MAG: putative LPS assembly protein LptD, partial [Flammeovirgaceae bacterium]|nr:putative LPS assembly protein LptD [Flammeovirgaceae bacterium]MDW8287682.1 putative LPS assembly protein LptD [Flammeovirgaceae bacterium]